jgi:hypothetical protein
MVLKNGRSLIDIKTEIERLEKEDKKYFDAELEKVKWVQFWCFLSCRLDSLFYSMG